MKSRLVVVQRGILANRCLLLGCKLAIFPSRLPHVVFLASTCRTSHSLIIAPRLMDTDRGPLGSGMSYESWKNAIAWLLLPWLRIARSRFHTVKISNGYYMFVSWGFIQNMRKIAPFENSKCRIQVHHVSSCNSDGICTRHQNYNCWHGFMGGYYSAAATVGNTIHCNGVQQQLNLL